MERFPVELIYLIVFAGFVLVNWLTQAAAQRRRKEELEELEEENPDEAGQPPFESERPEYGWGRDAPPEPAPVPAPVLTTRPAPRPVRHVPLAARRLHPARALLTDRRDLRRAVILSMVLGPCRAQEPPEQR